MADWTGIRRQIFPDGTTVPVLGYGAMELRGLAHRRPRPLDPAVAAEVLNAALDAGIGFIDTSIDYGWSEELIGEAISHRRDEYLLASKAGCPLHDQVTTAANGTLIHDYSHGNIRAGIEQSLRRLRTDHLDLLQLHVSPSHAVLEAEAVIETLRDLQREGKTRHIGISSTLPNLADHIALGVFEAFQLPYSAVERQLEPYLQDIRATGAGVIVRGGVSQGGTRGKPVAGGGTRAAADLDLAELQDGDTLSGFLLRYAITNPDVSTVIVGTASADHLRANATAALRGPLLPDVYAEARRRLDAAGFRAD